MTRWRAYAADPLWITLRRAGVCQCGAELRQGSRAFFYPRGRSLHGQACGCGERAARDFADQAEAEAFLGGGS